jgi:hypothetical protein
MPICKSSFLTVQRRIFESVVIPTLVLPHPRPLRDDKAEIKSGPSMLDSNQNGWHGDE